MKYNYAKIPYSAAVSLGLEKIRRRTTSGAVIINESDLLTYGNRRSTFASKVSSLGGEVLTAFQAKQELHNNE